MKNTIALLLFCSLPLWMCAQPATGYTLRLRISTAQGAPLPGATVQLLPTGKPAAIADQRGVALLTVDPQLAYRLRISSLGYRTDTLRLSAPQQPDTLRASVVLQASSFLLQTTSITADRFERPLSELTVSLEVLRPGLVESSNRLQLDKAIEKVPGVSIVDGQANIRGGSGFSYGAGSRVSLLLNDIPILTADAGFPNWNDIPIEHTGQIEVLKGAASALYGSAALNGIINFRTAFAKKQPETRISSFASIYDQPRDARFQWWDRAPISFGGSLSHRQRAGKLDVVLGGFYLSDNSHNQNTYSRYGRFSSFMRYRINERLQAGLDVNFTRSANQDFFYWAADSTAYTGADGTLSRTEPIRYTLDPRLQYSDRAGNQHVLRGRFYHIDNQANAQRSNQSDQFYAEYLFQRRFSTADLEFTAGIVYSGSNVSAELYGDTTFTARNLALYAQAARPFGERLNVSIGLRWERNVLDNPGFSYAGGNRIVPSREEEARPVLRIGANYELAEATYLRGSFGQGYRFPAVAEKFIFTNVGGFLISPSPELQSETGWSTELAIKQGIQIDKFTGYVDLAYFWTAYQDMIEFNFQRLATGFQARNVGDTRIRGWELSFGGQGVLQGVPLRLTGGYLYVDPRFLDFDTTPLRPGQENSQGQRNANNSSSNEDILKYRAQHQFKIDLETDIGRFSPGLAFDYRSRIEAIDQTFFLFIPGLENFRDQYNDGYLLSSLRVAYRISEAISVSVLVDNVFNEIYSDRPGLVEAPRSFALRFNYRRIGQASP